MYDVGRCLLSDKLKQARMTQKELASMLDVTKQQINNYVFGHRVMSLSIAKNVATILGCEIDDLYEWEYVENRKKRQ